MNRPAAMSPAAAPPRELALANARLVLEGEVVHGAVQLRDGRIADVHPGRGVPAGAEDLGGDWLAPGLVELHTDNLERHLQPRAGVDWPAAAAIVAHDAEIAGVGITTVFDAIRVGSILGGRPMRAGRYARRMAREILAARARGALRIGHVLHLRAEICSETLLEELAEFGPEDGIGLVSLMDHTPGARQFRDMETYREYMIGKQGLSEAEFEAEVATLTALRARLGAAHEAGAVEHARRLGAILASHDDTTAAQVAASAAHGVRVAEFPTTQAAAAACRAHAIPVMMGAPNLIRGGSHSGNVAAAALAEAGLLDILSSDYVPSALLAGAVRLGEVLGDMAAGLATVTAAPAAAAGLGDRGRIAPGLRADLVRFADMGGVPVVRGVWVAGARAA